MIYVWCVFKIFILNPLSWLAKHPKALIPVVIVFAGLFVYISCNRPNAAKPGQTEFAPQQQKAPTVQQASHVLQTYSRVYYLAKFTEVSPTKVVLYSWYEWNGKEWKFQTSAEGVPFDKSVQGDYRITKR